MSSLLYDSSSILAEIHPPSFLVFPDLRRRSFDITVFFNCHNKRMIGMQVQQSSWTMYRRTSIPWRQNEDGVALPDKRRTNTSCPTGAMSERGIHYGEIARQGGENIGGARCVHGSHSPSFGLRV